ncbi:RND superfamily putative drug exporter [Aeromicrobium panaciterrae]|uniref:RND superfamily putative drug exporter n=1 Tax=Aeromicrobium panaciterrae TaxID=363861 RepID=A0ABU1UP83_9ACTN|nr:MMPL family transporter [Aeromicrobium panaciterrae]MDR7086988.1 RND superfamily putative drug exporter [Aeromicrobium panaciterrae]
MFASLGQYVARNPWKIILAWIVVAVVVVMTAPKLSSTTDEAEFLPGHYESIKAIDVQTSAFPDRTDIGAIIVFDRKDGEPLTAADSADIEKIAATLSSKNIPQFGAIVAAPPSENKLVQTAIVSLGKDADPFGTAILDSAKELRTDLKPLVADTDLKAGTTGSVPQSLDQQESSESALVIVGIATIGLILILLLLIFRSPIIAFLPIAVVAVVSQIATGLIGFANDAFNLKADSSIQVILLVVLYGIGTDYILFFLFRYREFLRKGHESKEAVALAVERAGEAITSAGGAVIVAFMALILSTLSIFRSIGPALAIAVAVTVLASLTLVPAIISLLGTKVFWPSKAWKVEPKGARFGAVGDSLGRHPLRYAIASGLVLAALAVFALGFKPTFDLGDTGSSSTAESSVALKTLEKGLPPGATDPSAVFLKSKDGSPLDEAAVATYGTELAKAKGIAQVAPPTFSEDKSTAVFTTVLDTDPATDAAMANMKDIIRPAAHAAAPDGTEALVGGTTSVFVDLQRAMNRDYSVVFPVAAVIIMVILALLLRSLVAPWYLMASVGLGFGATLGAAVLLFQNIQGQDGLIFMLPIYIYLFVVALGTDYNILMIARLREESRQGKGSREAAAQAVRHAGPTVAAAGVILAGTFASLMLGGNSLLVSMGFAISFGIFVSAFVMAMFFTPALTALIGHAAWWPGHGDETAEEKAARTG